VNEPEPLAGWRALLADRRLGIAAAGAALVLLAAGLWWVNSRSAPTASAPTASDMRAALSVAQVSADAGVPPLVPSGAAEPSPAGAVAAGAAPGPGADAGALAPTVKLVFRTFPPRRALVMWGAKRLGFIDRGAPLVVERPRDSGPLDVVIRADKYLPVHTRAYTFNDAAIDVRITPIEKKDTIYGYKEPLPPDAGAPVFTDLPPE